MIVVGSYKDVVVKGRHRRQNDGYRELMEAGEGPRPRRSTWPRNSGAKLKAAKAVRNGYAETSAYTRFSHEHWRSTRTNNSIERWNREIRKSTRAVGALTDGRSAPMLVTV